VVQRLRDAATITATGGVLALTPLGEQAAREQQLMNPDGVPGDPPFRVHLGAIATGKTVRKDPELFQRLERVVRKTIGVEMEAAAIGYVAQHLGRRAIVVKAVSDYADEEKDDSFRAYASRASAEFLLRFAARRGPLATPAPAPAGFTAPAAAPRPTIRASVSKNPYHPSGTLEPGHPTYVVRPCDGELEDALRTHPLIAVEGPYRVGKSSLLIRALAPLHTAVHLDISRLRTDGSEVFHEGFFRLVSRQLGEPIKEWTDLHDRADRQQVTIGLDEFGQLTPSIAASFVPALHGLATSHPGRARVVVFLPGSIESFVESLRINNPKYIKDWRRIDVGNVDDDGVDRLLSLLPARARALAASCRDTIVERSGRHPQRVQSMCYALFDAHERGLPDDALLSLIGDRTRYG
jgi:hypothetical protein